VGLMARGEGGHLENVLSRRKASERKSTVGRAQKSGGQLDTHAIPENDVRKTTKSSENYCWPVPNASKEGWGRGT